MTYQSIGAAIACACFLFAFFCDVKRLEQLADAPNVEQSLAWPAARALVWLVFVLATGSAI